MPKTTTSPTPRSSSPDGDVRAPKRRRWPVKAALALGLLGPALYAAMDVPLEPDPPGLKPWHHRTWISFGPADPRFAATSEGLGLTVNEGLASAEALAVLEKRVDRLASIKPPKDEPVEVATAHDSAGESDDELEPVDPQRAYESSFCDALDELLGDFVMLSRRDLSAEQRGRLAILSARALRLSDAFLRARPSPVRRRAPDPNTIIDLDDNNDTAFSEFRASLSDIAGMLDLLRDSLQRLEPRQRPVAELSAALEGVEPTIDEFLRLAVTETGEVRGFIVTLAHWEGRPNPKWQGCGRGRGPWLGLDEGWIQPGRTLRQVAKLRAAVHRDPAAVLDPLLLLEGHEPPAMPSLLARVHPNSRGELAVATLRAAWAKTLARTLYLQSQLRLERTRLAIEMFSRVKGRRPASLDELGELGRTPPTDPLSGRPFCWDAVAGVLSGVTLAGRATDSPRTRAERAADMIARPKSIPRAVVTLPRRALAESREPGFTFEN